MIVKCLCLIALTLGVASAAPKKQNVADIEKITPQKNDRVAGLYVKDSENGDLRFLTGSSNLGTSTALNNFITQQQNLLEQLRPTTTNNGLNLGTGTTNLGTLGTLSSLTGSTSTNGVTPIVINLGNGGTTASTTNALQAAAAGSSPIGDLLPQIIAQAVFNQRRQPNRNANRRRVVNNRRRPSRGGNKNGQVYVIRPN